MITIVELLFVLVKLTDAFELKEVHTSPEAALVLVDACELSEKEASECLRLGDETGFGTSNLLELGCVDPARLPDASGGRLSDVCLLGFSQLCIRRVARCS